MDSMSFEQKSRGRFITWSIHVYEAHIGKLLRKWAGLKKIIQVHKIVDYKGKTTHSDRFYISDLATNEASFYHENIRQHWLIENQLHWVKDMVHKEDKNRIRKGNGPINMSIISTMTINLHRMKGEKSITESQIKFGGQLKRAIECIRT